MAKVTVTPAAHPADATSVTTGLTVLTSTGSGNGFEFAYANAKLVVLHNDTGSSATVTFLANQPTAYSDRGMTVPDDTVTLADGATMTWIPQTIFRDGNKNVGIEATQLIKCKVFSDLTQS